MLRSGNARGFRRLGSAALVNSTTTRLVSRTPAAALRPLAAAAAAGIPHPGSQRRSAFASAPQPSAERRPGQSPPPVPSEVANFVREEARRYDGGADFLAGPTPRTKALHAKVLDLLAQEVKEGIIGVDVNTPSSVSSHGPGYVDRENELVVGLQTEAPLVRAIKPYGGISVVRKACESFGFELSPAVEEIFTKYRKTHSDGVFDIYAPEHRAARKSGIITGLPDGYGRGRIIGDYRRVPLFGVDRLIAEKQRDHDELARQEGVTTPAEVQERLQLVEEVQEQIKALHELKEMGQSYGVDLSKPAETAKDAIQALYLAYLGAIKQQDGAAMSFGRVDSFLDIFIERDIAAGTLTEEGAQELVDDFVLKLRLVRHLRTPEYNNLFAGDPQWVTLVVGGQFDDGSVAVTKTSFRLLQTLRNLGPAPEPNLTVLWSQALPEGFKRFAALTSIESSSIQYENDDAMRPRFGGDYSIACCVSPMATGQQMQFFGARCNLAKLLLYALNNGRDEVSGEQIAPEFEEGCKFPLLNDAGELDYDGVMERFEKANDWLAGLYVSAMNAIHFSHDKYCYESLEMALHDTHAERMMAFGVAGLSVVADSLSAIKHASVKPVYSDEFGTTKAFVTEGDFPKFGNDNDAVDSIACDALSRFDTALKQRPTYRDAAHTLSVLTITSNVVYGKITGDTPDGRKQGEPFAPGANPMHGRDSAGALASLNSVAKLPFEHCLDGISNTFSLVPSALGKGTDEDRSAILAGVLDGYFDTATTGGGHHLNVNVLHRETLEDAMKHPHKYPTLTIRVSGYAVNFIRLTREQQLEVIARTFHDSM